MSDVSAATDGAQVIPGDPDAIEDLAGRLRQFAVGMSDAAIVLGQIGSNAWSGEGAAAFREQLSMQPSKFTGGSEAFTVAATALEHYAAELRAAQRQADQAVQQYQRGQLISSRWHDSGQDDPRAEARFRHAPPGAIPDPVDPGEPDRDEARAGAEHARARVQQAAGALIPALRKAAESAPDRPSRLHWLSGGLDPVAGTKLRRVYARIGAGAADALTGMGRGIWSLTGAAFENPGQFAGAWKGLALYLEGDPASREAFASDFVDWDEWSDDPLRAFGHAATDIGTLLIGGAAATKVGLLGKLEAPAQEADVARVALQRMAANATKEHPVELDGAPAYRGMPTDAQFSQKSYNLLFSARGSFTGTPVARIAQLIRLGALRPSDVPVDLVRVDGHALIGNTRSAQALVQAGVPRSQWLVRDLSGDKEAVAHIRARLDHNRLKASGTGKLKDYQTSSRIKALDEKLPREPITTSARRQAPLAAFPVDLGPAGHSNALPTYR